MTPLDALDTPHGRQLKAGFKSLRFEPALEVEYRATALQGLTYPTLVAALAGLAVWLLFVGVDLARLNVVQRFPHWPPALWQLAAVRTSVLLAFIVCAAALWSGRGRIRQRAMVAGMFLLLTLGSAVANAVYLELQEPHEGWVVALIVMAIFLPLGLSFFESAALSLACIGTTIVIGVLLPEPAMRAAFLHAIVAMLVTGVASAIGAYLREYAQRGQFLLLRELEWQASRDPLTGLFNRRVFARQLDSAIHDAQHTNQPVLLVMLDVDHFKLYNDTYGHQAGDQALQRLARVLDSPTARPVALAFRMGGEEMGLILREAMADDAHALGAQILRDVHGMALPHAASATTDRLSLSAGCAVLQPGESAASLHSRADQLLYRAKALGRNCVVMDPAMGGSVLHGKAHRREMGAAD